MLRTILLSMLVACGGSSTGGTSPDASAPLLAPPDACDVMQLSYTENLGTPTSTSGVIALGGSAFGNAQVSAPGELIIYAQNTVMGTPPIHIYFDTAVVDGGTVAARGVLAMPDQGFTAGNCATDPLVGSITVGKDMTYKFVLANLRSDATCSGAAVTGSFAGCYRR